jgi:hypothetical protein
MDLRETVERFENALILEALERARWNKLQAAKLLRVNRTTLVEKLKVRQQRYPEFAAAVHTKTSTRSRVAPVDTAVQQRLREVARQWDAWLAGLTSRSASAGSGA